MNLAERKKKVIFIGVISILIIIGLVFFLPNKKEDAGALVEDYYAYLAIKDYKKMYAMLTKGSLSQTSQDVWC